MTTGYLQSGFCFDRFESSLDDFNPACAIIFDTRANRLEHSAAPNGGSFGANAHRNRLVAFARAAPT